MVEDPPGDASGGLLRHVHVHGTVAGLRIEADEPAAREPVDFQQVVVTPGPAVFAPVVHRPFAQMPGQARVGENAATRLLACRIIRSPVSLSSGLWSRTMRIIQPKHGSIRYSPDRVSAAARRSAPGRVVHSLESSS